MAKKIVTLKNEAGDELYPRALATEIYDAGGNRVPVGGAPTVDDALDGTSENPVQNKVVKGALDGKADAVDIDGKEGVLKEGLVMHARTNSDKFANGSIEDPKERIFLFTDGDGEGHLYLCNPDGLGDYKMLAYSDGSDKGTLHIQDGGIWQITLNDLDVSTCSLESYSKYKKVARVTEVVHWDLALANVLPPADIEALSDSEVAALMPS